MLIESSYSITRSQREQLNKHKAYTIWFTGLSGSGKSTLANAIEQLLYQRLLRTIALDGDSIRKGLCKDLTFNAEDRSENIRRIGELAKLFNQSGTIVLAAFITPFAKDRALLREILQQDLIMIHVDCSLEQCEQRDVKGLYKKARAGEITNFTGIDSPYELPTDADLVINSGEEALDQSINKIIEFLDKKQLLFSDPSEEHIQI